jgi:large subunit ribosomal protein L15
MPLIRRIPKRGFTNRFRDEAAVVNLESLNRFNENSAVTPEQLKEAGLVRRSATAVKILGQGELNKPLTIHAHRFSRTASEKIQKAGGRAEMIKATSEKTSQSEKAR